MDKGLSKGPYSVLRTPLPPGPQRDHRLVGGYAESWRVTEQKVPVGESGEWLGQALTERVGVAVDFEQTVASCRGKEVGRCDEADTAA